MARFVLSQLPRRRERNRLNLKLSIWIILFLVFCFVEANAAEKVEEAAATPSLQGLAELPLEELEKIQVTTIATRTRQPIAEAPAIASVITAKDIETMGAQTFEEALKAVPGVHVSLSSQAMAPKYLIRGISTLFNPETLVMINGIPITSIVRSDRNARLAVGDDVYQVNLHFFQLRRGQNRIDPFQEGGVKLEKQPINQGTMSG